MGQLNSPDIYATEVYQKGMIKYNHCNRTSIDKNFNWKLKECPVFINKANPYQLLVVL